MAQDRRERLLEAGLILSRELSLAAVLKRIVELAVEITDARYGALGVLDANGRIADFITVGVTEEERGAIGHPPHGHGILGVLIREPKPLRLREISRDPRSYGFPPNHPPMKSFLGAPVMARGQVFGNIYLTEKQGAGEFSAQDEQALTILAAQAGVAVENARLYEASTRREMWLDALREIATAILERSEPEDVLETVARRAREMVGADLATIAVPADRPEHLQLRVVEGTRADELRGMTFPMAGSVSGEVMHTGRPALIEDAAEDHRVHQPVVRIGDVGPALLVPLVARGKPYGTLAVANRRGGPSFRPEELQLIETFARQAAVAVGYGEALREIQRLVVIEDRERIAKELHDGIIQSIFAVGMGLEGLAATTDDERAAARIRDAVAELDQVIKDLRGYIFGLRPGVLAERALDQALRVLADDFQEKTGVVTVVDVESRAGAELADRAADLIQMTREALSNIGRHAGAHTCRVSLHGSGGAAVLEIDDDGAGFDPSAETTGHGLRNIRERAERLGARLELASEPGTGTTIRVTLPLSPA